MRPKKPSKENLNKMNQSQVTDLQVKLSLEINDETILKRIPTVQTFDELMQQVKKVCKKAEVDTKQKLSVFYMDADNDKIRVYEDVDLQMAYALALSSNNRVKFHIECAKQESVSVQKPLEFETIKLEPIEEPTILTEPIEE